MFVFAIAFEVIIKYLINDDSRGIQHWHILQNVHEENGIHSLTLFTFAMLSHVDMSVEIEYSVSEWAHEVERAGGMRKRFPVGALCRCSCYVCNCVHLVKSLECKWNCKRRENVQWIQLKVFSRLTVKCKHKKIISELVNYCAEHAKVLPWGNASAIHTCSCWMPKETSKNTHFISLHRIASHSLTFAWQNAEKMNSYESSTSFFIFEHNSNYKQLCDNILCIISQRLHRKVSVEKNTQSFLPLFKYFIILPVECVVANA